MIFRRHLMLVFVLLVNLFGVSANASTESYFWSWFQANQSVLFNNERDQERIFDELASEMHKVHPSLTFEFGPKINGQREFVISADGILEAFPKVESLYASAPKLSKWQFIKFRPRRAPSDISYGGVQVKASNVSVILKAEGNKVGITVLMSGYTKAAHKSYMGIAFLMLDQALGEYDVEKRVGNINVQAPNAFLKDAITLQQLPSKFDALFLIH